MLWPCDNLDTLEDSCGLQSEYLVVSSTMPSQSPVFHCKKKQRWSSLASTSSKSCRTCEKSNSYCLPSFGLNKFHLYPANVCTFWVSVVIHCEVSCFSIHCCPTESWDLLQSKLFSQFMNCSSVFVFSTASINICHFHIWCRICGVQFSIFPECMLCIVNVSMFSTCTPRGLPTLP
jgi:hypothetical protein